METILSSPIERTHLVFGKFLLVLTASLATATLSVLVDGGFVHGACRDSCRGQGIGEGLSDHLRCTRRRRWRYFVMAVPMAVLFSSALITISLFAKTFKEAQSYLTPMTFLGDRAGDRGGDSGNRADDETGARFRFSTLACCARSWSPGRITGITSR